MTSPTNLSTERGLQAYLKDHSVEAVSATLLTGGNANYVYRVIFQNGKTVIYKHAAPYLHSNANFALDPARMDYEAHVLQTLPAVLNKSLPASAVHAVGFYHYDSEQKLLCIEDGGTANLKDAYTNPELDIPRIGRDLGKWIAALHMSSKSTSLSLTDQADLAANNPIAVNVYRHSYNGLATAISGFGQDTKIADRINDEFGSRLTSENECVCHGDFWPGNVLVNCKGESNNETILSVVDWEMTRRGTSATDVGQFAAEAFLLDRFRGGRGLLPAFLGAYLEARERDQNGSQRAIGKEWIKRMVVHWAVHIAFWPVYVEWSNREETGKLVDIGVRVMTVALNEKWAEMMASELFDCVRESWARMLEDV